MNYKNITVSGLPGAGSSTLAKTLAEVLNWQYFSGGDFMRAHAIEKGLFDSTEKSHHDATIYDDDFDRQVDYKTREAVNEGEGNIIDAWISGFMAQGIKDTLKILVFCSSDDIRIDRIVNRDNVSIEDAKRNIFDREAKNLAKWQRLYEKEWQDWVVSKHPFFVGKPIYFWYPQLYDLCLDTYGLGPQESLNAVLKVLNFKK